MKSLKSEIMKERKVKSKRLFKFKKPIIWIKDEVEKTSEQLSGTAPRISSEAYEVMLDHAKKLEGIIEAQDEQILALKRLIYLETKVLKLKGVGK